jgi:hypothetical protein
MGRLVLVAMIAAGFGAQARSADDVLREMRAALGGEAALDAIKTLSVSGSQIHRLGGRSHENSIELFVLLPAHYLSVSRSLQMLPGPGSMNIDTTNYSGFRGDVLIRRTESNIPYPPDPDPPSVQLQFNKRRFARIALALFGKGFAGEAFSYVGQETVDKQTMDVIEMRAADDFVTRLYVNQASHLPAAIAWLAPAPVMFTATSTSTVTTRNGEVVSQTPPTTPVPVPGNTTPGPPVTWKITLSDFKLQDGLNWPHRFSSMVDGKPGEELRFGKFKLNPKIDERRFDIKR